jgi:predicted DNA-binding ribbon-helix-helix protein
MCKIFVTLDENSCGCKTRSIRLGGHVTSIRLEALFWEILEEIAAVEHATLGHFLTTLYDEVLELHGEIANFTALLRCACVHFVTEIKGNAKTESSLPKSGTSIKRYPGVTVRNSPAPAETQA